MKIDSGIQSILFIEIHVKAQLGQWFTWSH